MSKNTEIKFVGQPIFKQIIDLVQKVNIFAIIKAHNSDHYYKAFKSRTHLITMLHWQGRVEEMKYHVLPFFFSYCLQERCF
jgi:hypothetical protein